MKIKRDKSSTGFTIIELIVVIAVIAVLATIVSASVMIYIDKGKNAAIKGNMANLFTYGVGYIANNGNYNNFCDDLKTIIFLDEVDRLADPNSVECNCDTGSDCVDAKSWCTIVTLRSTSSAPAPIFCIDSTGKKIAPTGYSLYNCNHGFCGTSP